MGILFILYYFRIPRGSGRLMYYQTIIYVEGIIGKSATCHHLHLFLFHIIDYISGWM